jgi:hypothetical protein
MSIQKKSLISNRNASKKANLAKGSATKVSSTKTAKLSVSLVAPQVSSSNNLAVSLVAPQVKG